jgi:CubicO group peptidase (beta-lactamase class C family)
VPTRSWRRSTPRPARSWTTPDTLFEIGSSGKSFTALLVMQLADAGEIDLDAPVGATCRGSRQPHAS